MIATSHLLVESGTVVHCHGWGVSHSQGLLDAWKYIKLEVLRHIIYQNCTKCFVIYKELWTKPICCRSLGMHYQGCVGDVIWCMGNILTSDERGDISRVWEEVGINERMIERVSRGQGDCATAQRTTQERYQRKPFMTQHLREVVLENLSNACNTHKHISAS